MEPLSYRLAKIDDHGSIMEHLMNYFRTEEPLCQAIKATREDTYDIFNDMIRESLSKPISFICVNQCEDIVGCRLNSLIDTSDRAANFDRVRKYNENISKIDTFLNLLGQGLERMLPECKILKFLIVSVRPDYQKKGIATRLIRMSMDKARELDCLYVCTLSVSSKSQALFKKLNFDTLKVIEHKNYLDENGSQIFVCGGDTTCGKLMVKKL